MDILEFKRESIIIEGKEVEYEWAIQDVFDTKKVVFHFFLKGNTRNNVFSNYLNETCNHLKEQCKAEYFYTEEFDGHDLILSNIEGYKAKIIKDKALTYLKSILDK